MYILMLLIAYLVLFFAFSLKSSNLSIKKSIIKSGLTFSSLVVLITEVLNFFGEINLFFISLSWLLVILIPSIYIILNKRKFQSIIADHIKKLLNYKLKRIEVYFVSCTILLLILIFIQGIIYPPNTWDSMTYHLARVQNWISFESVDHYPTNIIRQLYQPPFSEFVIMHFNILSSGDYFSNSVQFIFLILSLVTVLSIVELFTNNRKIKFGALILSVTIPEVVLQGSSTQNDIVVGFFILSCSYFTFKSLSSFNYRNLLWTSVSIGLAILTKGTAYLFLLPILILLLIFGIRNVIYNPSYLLMGILSALLCVFINSGHFYRNYNLTENLLGIDEDEKKLYSNEKMSFLLLFSNLLKNAGVHSGIYPLNSIVFRSTEKLHKIIDIELNNPATNFNNLNVSAAPDISNHEDKASNTIHFILLFLTLIWLIKRYTWNKLKLDIIAVYGLIIIMQIIIFSAFLKWQPWHSRLHTPVFLLSVPLISLIFSTSSRYNFYLFRSFYLLVPFAFFLSLFNYSRPYINSRFTSEVNIFDSRYKKYFTNSLSLYNEYKYVTSKISKIRYKQKVGLDLGGDDWEYPLFVNNKNGGIQTVHIKIENSSHKLSIQDEITCILSTKSNAKFIKYNNSDFLNITPGHNYIFLFIKVN